MHFSQKTMLHFDSFPPPPIAEQALFTVGAKWSQRVGKAMLTLHCIGNSLPAYLLGGGSILPMGGKQKVAGTWAKIGTISDPTHPPGNNVALLTQQASVFYTTMLHFDSFPPPPIAEQALFTVGAKWSQRVGKAMLTLHCIGNSLPAYLFWP